MQVAESISVSNYNINVKSVIKACNQLSLEEIYFSHKSNDKKMLQYDSLGNINRVLDNVLIKNKKVSNNIKKLIKIIENYCGDIEDKDKEYKRKYIKIKSISTSVLFRTTKPKVYLLTEEERESAAEQNFFQRLTGSVVETGRSVITLVKGIKEDIEKNGNAKDYLVTAGIASLLGLGQVLEETADCTIQATSEVLALFYSGGIKFYELLGVDDKYIEKLRNPLDKAKAGVGWVVGSSWTTKWTKDILDSTKYGTKYDDAVIQTVRGVEDSVGSIMLSKLPGPWAAIASAVTSEGRAAERAYQNGSTFEGAALSSHVEGGIGFLLGGALSKIKELAKGATSVKDVLGYTVMAAGASAGANMAESGARYAAYGKNQVDENGNPLYEDFSDYYVDTGDAFNTLVGAVTAGASTAAVGTKALRIYNGTEIKKEAMKALMAASKGEFKGYFTEEEVKEAMDNIVICKTRQEFETLYKNANGTGDPNRVLGFFDPSTGKLYIGDRDASTIVHEAIHKLAANADTYEGGLMTMRYNPKTGHYETYNMLNEGATEYFADRIMHHKNLAYDDVVPKVRRFNEIIETVLGDEQLLKKAYFNGDPRLELWFDAKLGKGAYSEFLQNLEGSSIYSYNENNYFARIRCSKRVDEILDKLYLECVK